MSTTIVTNIYSADDEYIRDLKMMRIRAVRDMILSKTDWITSYISKENEAVRLGIVAESNRKWSDTEIGGYLGWCKFYLDLPQKYEDNNYALLAPLNLDDIYMGNLNIFPVCPLDQPLTKIDNVDQ